MSIRAYLKKDVTKTPGFQETNKEYYLSGIPVRRDRNTGSFFVVVSISNHVLSFKLVKESLGDLVEKYSLHTRFKSPPKRVCGFYRYGDAVGEVDLQGNDYLLTIYGKTLKHVVGLYRRIRAGSIFPVKSWEEEQIKSSPTKNNLDES